MTVNSATSTASYTGNGTTTAFSVPFYFLVDTDLKVSKKLASTGVTTVLTLNSDYTLSGAGNQLGGTLTTAVAPATGDQLYIERNVTAVQQTAYPENNKFPSASHEKALDRLTMLAQQTLSKLTFGLFRDPLGATFDLSGGTLVNSGTATNGNDVPGLAQVQQITASAATGIIPSLVATYTTLATSVGSTLVGFLQGGTGASLRNLQAKVRELGVSVKDFGAVGDGVVDDLAAINAAITYVDGLGGGVVRFPKGKYRITAPLVIGNGSDSQVSTIHNRIALRGDGRGGSTALAFQQINPVSEIYYDGTSGSTVKALNLAGPLHSLEIESLVINANGKAGYAVEVNHVTDSRFRFMVKGYTAAGFNLTTRSGFPSGCVFGCANNSFIDCYAYEPANFTAYGVKLSSGVSTASTLTSQPDTANNDFISCVFFYGGSTGSAGAYMDGADNNTFYGCQFIPTGGNDGGGKSLFFNPWPGDTRFPMENVFVNSGASQTVGGISGTLGNTIVVHQEGDGSSLPLIANLNVMSTHDGKCAIGGKRSFRIRDTAQAAVTTPASTSSTTYVDVTGMTVTLSNVKAGASLRILVSARVGKFSTTTGSFVLVVDGVAQGATQIDVGATSYYHALSMNLTLTGMTAGSHTVKLQYLSADANNVSLQNGVLIVDELF